MKPFKISSKIGALTMIVMAFAFNCFTGAALGATVGHPFVGMALTNGLGVAQNCVRMWHSYQGASFSQPLILRSGLNQEVWIDQLVEQLYADDSFVEDGEDWTEWVENHQVNFAAEGAKPTVFINNSAWPMTPAARTDAALAVTLDNFQTTPTRVQDIEQVELAYNKLNSVNKEHAQTILETFGIYAAFNWAPVANTANTPVIVATGAADPVTGLKAITKADIANLAMAYDNLLLPDKGRTLVMNPSSMWSLIQSDATLLQQYGYLGNLGQVPGVITDYYGFKIRKYVYTPTYRLVSSIWTKNAYGSTPVPGTDFNGAISYIAKNGIAKAWGRVKMFSQMNEPTYQADVISYSARGTARAKQQARIGAIIQTT